jgi:hypothetical protein
MINHELINFQDKLYYVYRKYDINKVKQDKIHELMKLLECDIVVKKDNPNTMLYYLREIPNLSSF